MKIRKGKAVTATLGKIAQTLVVFVDATECVIGIGVSSDCTVNAHQVQDGLLIAKTILQGGYTS